MSALKDIRKRLHSAGNIKQITDAMERVAAVHLKKALGKAEESRPYLLKLKEILGAFDSQDLSHPLSEQRAPQKIGLVVVSSDRGLCGSYNANIFNKSDHFLKNSPSKSVELILVGRKAIEYYKKKKWHSCLQQPSFNIKTSFQDVYLFSKQLIDFFLSKQLDQVWVIYTQYISAIERKVVTEKFLPIEKQEVQTKSTQLNYIFEPDKHKIFLKIVSKYLDMHILTALQEAYAAELASRVFAMRSASKNSEDLIYQLTLVSNKIRQAEITRETIEISSGSENAFAN